MVRVDHWETPPFTGGTESEWMVAVFEQPDGPVFLVDMTRLGHMFLDDDDDEFTNLGF